jgi:hypothetical protein
MNEVKALLDRVAGPDRQPRPDELSADLARGRSGLRRRRRQMIALGGFALVLAAGVVAAGPSLLRNDPRASPPEVAGSTDPDAQEARIRFVAYGDPQPEGFHVTTVPAGWRIQAVNEVVLVIAPPELMGSRPDVFVGKLVVMLESSDFDRSKPLPGSAIKVGDRDGSLLRAENYGILWCSDDAGHLIHVQWPLSAGWSDTEITSFAAGIQVLPAAVPGRG